MAETHIESNIGTIQNNVSDVYNFLSNFDNIGAILPPNQVKDWGSSGDTCSFTADKVGKVTLQIVDLEENKTIKITGSDIPFQFFLWIQLIEAAPYTTKIRLTVKAELNAMMKMMVKKPLKKGLDQLVEQLSVMPFHRAPKA